MQLAGIPGPLCSQKILLESDGTWCARCETVMHRDCLTAAGNVCPRCAGAYDAPEGHFVYSKRCPECFRLNDPPRARCAGCEAGTRWDSPDAYAAFRKHMKRTSIRSALLGLLEIAIGASCLLSPVFLPPVGMVIFFLLVFPAGAGLYVAMKMLIEGFGNLVRSWQCSGFE